MMSPQFNGLMKEGLSKKNFRDLNSVNSYLSDEVFSCGLCSLDQIVLKVIPTLLLSLLL